MKTSHERLIPWAIFFVVFAVYAGFLTKNYYWDGITFAQVIENAGSLNVSLLHPSHLIYNVFGYLVYRAAYFFGFNPRAVSVLQVCNCFFGALTATALFYVFRSLFRSVHIAVLLVCLFSFSATWWKFATDANSYIPSIFFLVLSFYLILPGKKPTPGIVALTHVAAMCLHQLAIFFFPVIVVGLYIQSSDDPRKRFSRIAKYSVIAGVSTLGLYCLCFYLLTGSFGVREFMNWMTYYSTENGFVFNASQSISWTLSGTVKLFFGGRFSFFKEVANPLTILLAILDALVLIGFLTLLVFGLVKTTKGDILETSQIAFRQLVLICMVWAASYALFLFFWIPKNVFYRMFYLTPLIVLLGVWISRSKFLRSHRLIPALFVATMILSNFLFYIVPYSKVRRETPLGMAMEMNKAWTPKSVIYFLAPDGDNNLIQYFNPTTKWRQIHKIEPEMFEAELREIYANGGDAWVEHSAFDAFAKDEVLAKWMGERSNDQTTHKINDPIYNIKFVKLIPKDQ